MVSIKDIFGTILMTHDPITALKQANAELGYAWKAWHKAGGFPNVQFTEKNGVKHTMVAFHSHIVKALIELLPPIEKPDWLFIGGYTTCYVYCDKRIEENRDYKTILHLFYSPLRIEITADNKRKYPEVLELALQELKQLQMRCNEPLRNPSDQQTHLSLSSGPDVIVK